MDKTFRNKADIIISKCIKAVLPDEAVKESLENYTFSNGKIILVATGKAAWQMANTASEVLKDKINDGIVITKYEHVNGEILNVECFEAGHPVPDENSFNATKKALEKVTNLSSEDTVLFLVSGGGSALFESPLIEMSELQDITSQLLSSGADIVEINTIRKRLSDVKGGKFALHCLPANVYSIVLSDVLGDPLDMIASGPTYPDSSTNEDAFNIIKKYNINISDKAKSFLNIETPKEITNVKTVINGSVKKLCEVAMLETAKMGYKPILLTESLDCTAQQAGMFLGSIAKTYSDKQEKIAFIAGGETVVKVTGTGIGGRNQEIALASCPYIQNTNCAIFSVGSDGTDGPTDAAGGFVDGTSFEKLKKSGINVSDILQDNNSYNALKSIDGLIITGPTGTNVNDVSIVLIN